MRAIGLLVLLALACCAKPIPTVSDSDPVFALVPDRLQPTEVPQ